MKETINYLKFTCDICGKDETIIPGVLLHDYPEKWQHIRIDAPYFDADMCQDCLKKLVDFISELVAESDTKTT